MKFTFKMMNSVLNMMKTVRPDSAAELFMNVLQGAILTDFDWFWLLFVCFSTDVWQLFDWFLIEFWHTGAATAAAKTRPTSTKKKSSCLACKDGHSKHTCAAQVAPKTTKKQKQGGPVNAASQRYVYNFVSKWWIFVLQMMNFVFKMMDFSEGRYRRWRRTRRPRRPGSKETERTEISWRRHRIHREAKAERWWWAFVLKCCSVLICFAPTLLLLSSIVLRFTQLSVQLSGGLRAKGNPKSQTCMPVRLPRIAIQMPYFPGTFYWKCRKNGRFQARFGPCLSWFVTTGFCRRSWRSWRSLMTDFTSSRASDQSAASATALT